MHPRMEGQRKRLLVERTRVKDLRRDRALGEAPGLQ